jgi:glycosyltransferase involved in cell wall biosynthesis
MKVAVLFHRLGPYHFARLTATSALCHVHAIEFSSQDDTYAWDDVVEVPEFDRTVLFTDCSIDQKSSVDIKQVLRNVLTAIEPDVVVIPGWSGRPAFLALAVSREMNIPAVAMSDSAERDEVRRWWKEWIKKRVVWNYSASLVAGLPHAAYMQMLGMSRERIFSGYDVVDNDYFAAGARNASQHASELRQKYNLPEHYFLGSYRFIPKKNIDRLIQAYALYQQRVDGRGWKLVLLGDGELMQQCKRMTNELGLESEVFFPGFKQYAELPVYYGLAKAYVQASTTEQWGLVVNEAMASGLPVLVSNRCGCAPDLVREAENGFTFDPYDVDDIAESLFKISMDGVDIEAMGRSSQQIISTWSPEMFAQSLVAACSAVLQSESRPFRFVDRWILFTLGRM